MMLKRQKIGSFQLMKEVGGDGIEMDMGGLGKRDTFDNKFHQPHFCKLFKETAQGQHIEVPSVADVYKRQALSLGKLGEKTLSFLSKDLFFV